MVKQKQDKRRGLYSLVGITFLILFCNFVLDANRYDRITRIECDTGLEDCPTGMQYRFGEKPDWYADANNYGWHEECIEKEVITHDRFLVKVNDKGGIVGLEIEYSDTHWDRPTFDDTHKLQESWNTTKCIKWMLVREERP